MGFVRNIKFYPEFFVMIAICFGFGACVHHAEQDACDPVQDAPNISAYFLIPREEGESYFGLFDNDKNETEKPLSEKENLAVNSGKSNFGKQHLVWPTKGILTSYFGRRTLQHRTRRHEGIDIGAPYGTPIRAVAQGRVLYSGWIRGYGNAVILVHDRTHQTLYAHMSKRNVRKGAIIARNDILGFVGRTGHTIGGPNLHFETRIHGMAQNPLQFLPRGDHGPMHIGMATPPYYLQSHKTMIATTRHHKTHHHTVAQQFTKKKPLHRPKKHYYVHHLRKSKIKTNPTVATLDQKS